MTAQSFSFQSAAKPDMNFTYQHSRAPKGEKFIIPASIPARMLEVQKTGQREMALLKGKSKKEKQEAEARVSTVLLDIFVNDVIPDDMRRVLHLPDAGPIFNMWSEYVELGEGQSSAD